MTSMILGLAAFLTLTTAGQPATLAAHAQQPPADRIERRDVRPDEFTNVRLDLTITDKTAAGDPVKKSVTLLVANGGEGRVRSNGTVFREATATDRRSAFEVTLNADTKIVSISGDRLRAHITVEYAPSADGSGADTGREQRGSALNQSVMVVLLSGKPSVIVESSDPLSDRKVTLEATATILR